MSRPKVGLVLSGGGARGAYEAGVIRYLREELPSALGGHVPLDILCGTSVGAITACFLAATMDEPATQGRELERIWSELSLERVYKVQGEDLWTITRKLWRAATNEPVRPEGWRLYDLLHPEPLEEMVRTRASWPRISANLARGRFDALSVSATQISTGKTIVFVQRREGGVPPWSRDPYTEARETILGPEHALASAAIPLLFRAVKIGEEYFCDGSIRQNTPLSPALRLGADRVLIVSLKAPRPDEPPADKPRHRAYPTTPMVMGKVLNALMLDHTDYDLDRMHRFNAILETGRRTYGPDFVEKINETVRAMRGQPYRVVHDLVLRPSRDIAAIAVKHARKDRLALSGSPTLPTKLLHRIAQSQLLTEADLASYLLFDGEYARDLIHLAMEDTHARREELIRFFGEAMDGSRAAAG
ncbi:MAG: patatin-like phospholipase family protein [Myxococcaceae bacterium]|nr:patatin-like phospholipase family protein [Myxococcaceae bacterium]